MESSREEVRRVWRREEEEWGERGEKVEVEARKKGKLSEIEAER